MMMEITAHVKMPIENKVFSHKNHMDVLDQEMKTQT
jgi:hypothetical protein